MSTFNPDTTWLGLLGGGVSGSILGGGSIYQIDLWHMGGDPLPVRALVTGKRVGVVAEVSTAMAALVVTGCRTGKEMDGITSSGIDWELAVGLKGSAIVKTGAKLFKVVAAEAAAKSVNWAVHESAKRFVQWTMNDLGVVQSGKQFNLIPSPLSLGVGAGIFYEWQTLKLLGGKIGWQHISPTWNVENFDGGVYFQLLDIPEQDGSLVHLGFSVPEWGIDPYIRWKKEKGEGRVGQKNYHIDGYSYEAAFFERRDGMGLSGINLSNYLPIGRLEEGIFTGFSDTKTVTKSGKLTVRPHVFEFSNYSFWSASDTMTVDVDSSGRFTRVDGSSKFRR
ncbi:MAG: hypothetical protein R2747_22730 [Pyrinomonadaceae bacterium]